MFNLARRSDREVQGGENRVQVEVRPGLAVDVVRLSGERPVRKASGILPEIPPSSDRPALPIV